MPRVARVVIPGSPHHVTQRGSHRQRVFFGEIDYVSYLRIARAECAAADVAIWAYCLMPNHVHLIAIPADETGLARAMGRTHQRYGYLVNQREGWSGHLWQDRFASFPMDEAYLERCVRYVGLNPVRAGLVSHAARWPWSSVRAHMGMCGDPLIDMRPLEERLGSTLSVLFDASLSEEDLCLMRNATVNGGPLVKPRRSG
jgi:putative transposase